MKKVICCVLSWILSLNLIFIFPITIFASEIRNAEVTISKLVRNCKELYEIEIPENFVVQKTKSLFVLSPSGNKEITVNVWSKETSPKVYEEKSKLIENSKNAIEIKGVEFKKIEEIDNGTCYLGKKGNRVYEICSEGYQDYIQKFRVIEEGKLTTKGVITSFILFGLPGIAGYAGYKKSKVTDEDKEFIEECKINEQELIIYKLVRNNKEMYEIKIPENFVLQLEPSVKELPWYQSLVFSSSEGSITINVWNKEEKVKKFFDEKLKTIKNSENEVEINDIKFKIITSTDNSSAKYYLGKKKDKIYEIIVKGPYENFIKTFRLIEQER